MVEPKTITSAVPATGMRAIAPGNADVPWDGRDRLDVSGFSRAEFSVAEGKGEILVLLLLQ